MAGVFFYLLIGFTAVYVVYRYGFHGEEMAERHQKESEDPDIPWWAKTTGPFPAAEDPSLRYFIGSVVAGIIAVVAFGLAIHDFLALW